VSEAALLRVRGFAGEIRRASWFAGCGEPLTAGDLDDASAYLAALGLAPCETAPVASWTDVAAITQLPDWSRVWWEAEEGERTRLFDLARAAQRECPLLAALTAVTQTASDVVIGAAAVAAARAGVADEALHRVAAGAATQACYQAALAIAADAGEAHGFAAKFRLFAAGRWPLGIVGDRFFVF
jgi:hypothetical protein